MTTTAAETTNPSAIRRRVELYKTGGPDSLRLIEDQQPEPKAREIRVRVRASGVAYADVMMRHGKYPGAPKIPFTPGYDVMGVVDAVGPDAQDFQPGDTVIAVPQFGGYADSVCVDERRAISVPQDIDAQDAVCLALNYVSAYQMLHHYARAKPGDKILVHSAAGGVGTALLQLGGLLGLTMYGTASAGKHDLVEACGGQPIDYRANDFVEVVRQRQPEGLDAVFDPIGADHWLRSRKTLKKGGVLVGFGLLSAFEDDRPVGSLIAVVGRVLRLKVLSAGRRFVFFGINFAKDPPAFRRDLQAVVDLYLAGKIKPHVGKVLPLSEAAEAHRLLAAGAVRGKIVLVPDRADAPR